MGRRHRCLGSESRRGRRAAVALLWLALGTLGGVVYQKTVGVGRLVESVGDGMADWLGRRAEPAGHRTVVPPEAQGSLAIYVLAGQSNMSGRGRLTAYGAPNDSRVFVFGNDYRWRVAQEPLDDDAGQVDRVSRDLNSGVGPGHAFALRLLEFDPDLRIGLVPCAKGASSIREWQRSLDEKSLYGSCLKRCMAASPMGKISGILFFQGESDALDPRQNPRKNPAGGDWDALFEDFVTDLRADLGNPGLPVVFAQIGTTATPEVFPNWDAVRQAQEQVNMPWASMISTDDLALQDNVHFSTSSYQTIGRRFAEEMYDLVGAPGMKKHVVGE